MSVSFTWDKRKWDAYVKKIQTKLNPSEIDRVLKATAYEGQREFVKTLKSKSINWFVIKKNDGYVITTTSKVALFLESGTKAHGPKRKKFLYIPLRPNAAVWRKGMIFGKDYILTKWVRGIKGRNYLKPVSNEIGKRLVNNFKLKLSRL